MPCAWHVGGGGNTPAKGRRGHLILLLENYVPGGPPPWDLRISLGPRRGRMQIGQDVGFMIAISAAVGSIQVRGQPPTPTPHPLVTPLGLRQILEPSSSLLTVPSPPGGTRPAPGPVCPPCGCQDTQHPRVSVMSLSCQTRREPEPLGVGSYCGCPPPAGCWAHQ